MRKTAFLSLLAVLCIAFTFLFYQPQTKHSSTEQAIPEGPEAEQDGIMQALQQDFEMTKDVSLGFVPEYRLIRAAEDIVAEKQAMRSGRALRTSALTWTERGPYTDAIGPSNGNTRGASGSVTSGRMRAILVDLADPTNRTVWVGGVDGGLWKTNDITASPSAWTPINDLLGNLAVASIVQDPTNTDIMYFGTGEKSFNADAVRGGGIWKSTDHGVTWNLLGSTTSFWNVSRMAVDNAGNVYVATIGNNAGIQRSTDGGATWTSISPGGLSLRITEMKLSSTGRLHIVAGYYNTGAASAGYRYTDNPATVTSATWTSPATPFTPSNFNVEIATAGNTLYAVPASSTFETPAIYKSTDGGANWATTTTSPPVAVNSNTDLSSGQGWYCIAVGVDPANPNNVVVGGLNTYRSTDGGTTWTNVARWIGTGATYSYVHADQHFITWNNSQVLLATDGGLFYSADNGATYTQRNVNLRLKQFYACAIHPTSTNYFLAGAQDNGVHQLNGAGLSSSVEVTGGDGAYVHIDQDQPQYQFGSYVYNQYRRSTDGGSTWSSVNYSNTGSFINPTDYDNLNNKLYAGGSAGTYIRWDNPQWGTTFTPVTVTEFNGNNVTHVSVSPYVSDRVFFGTNGGRIVRVDNANLSTPTATAITGSSMNTSSVSCVAIGTDDNNLIATFSNYGTQHVWVSTTGGGSAGWTNITGNLPDIPVRWAMFYPNDNDKAIIATEAGVFETSDINGAATVWTQDPSFPIVRTNMLQYRPSDGTVIAATHGRGIFSAQIPVTSTYVQFQTSAQAKTEATTFTSGCQEYRDYTINLTVNRAPVGDAIATVSLVSFTGTQGVDFDFTTNGNFASPSNTLTFASGSSTPQPVTIRIYDDPLMEASETFTLSYSLSGSTDAVPGISNQTFTFVIGDNDATPVVAASQTRTIGVGDYPGGYFQPLRSSNAKARSQYIYLASELRDAGFTVGNVTSMGLNILTKESTQPYTGLTISLKNTSTTQYAGLAFETGTTPVYSGNYSTVVGMNTFTFSTPFFWDGISNLIVEICYNNTTGSGANGDFVSTHTTQTMRGVWNRAGTGTGCSLTAAFSGAGSYYIRPDITLTGNSGHPVENTLNASRSSQLGSNNDVYYYNANGKIIARIQNSSAHDYGCTQVIVDRAGTGGIAFWSNSPSTYLTQKTFRVIPTTNNTSGSYTITLYYSAAEKAGWESATGNVWSNIRMVKVNSQISNYSPASQLPDGPGGWEVVTPTLGMFGSDYTVTATFASGFSGFAVGIPGLAPLPMTLTSFQGKLENGGRSILLDWTTSFEQDGRNFDVEKSTDGTNFFRIGSVNAVGNSTSDQHYSLRDHRVAAANYYRLRMNDIDGKSKLSGVVLIRHNAAVQNLWVVNNPFSSHIDVRLAKTAQVVKLQLLNANGTLVTEKSFNNPSENFRWILNNTKFSNGTYFLRATVDNQVFNNKLTKQ